MVEADWKRIDSLVRPQRYALLINDTPYWHHTCQRAIEVFTQLWGGAGFIIVPTNGLTIAEKFWDILENYSPDYIGSYKTTLRDLKWADPDDYASHTDHLRSRFTSQGLDEQRANELIQEQETNLHINELNLSDGLKQELLDRLSPFHYARIVNRPPIYAGSQPDYPFTQVRYILPHSKTKPATVYRQKELADPIFNLMAKMRTGAINEQFESDLLPSGIVISDQLSSIPDKDYLNVIERGDPDRLARLSLEGAESLPENFLSNMPNALSTSGLGKYFRIQPGMTEKEYVTVVVGDKLEDFCFAYSLSKMLNDIYWMPDKPLRDAYSTVERVRRLREAGDEQYVDTEETQIVRNLASNYVQKIGYGHREDQKIVLTSTSLSVRQLRTRQQKILSLAYVGITEPGNYVIIRSANEIDVTHVGRLLEANNYANQQAMAFVENEGVESVRPVKPKHFDYIDPQHHRWIQTINISGFHPPTLAVLGNEILKNQSSRHEGRVGKDGISFLLPGIAYFAGNDIDTTLRSPELKILTSTDIFSQYFAGKYLVFPSDKGKYFDDTVDKFGTLDAAAEFFKSKKYNKLLNQFTEEVRSNEKERRDERIYLDYSSRAYLDLKAIRKVLGRGSNASSLVDYLLSIKVLRRGLILYCNRCSCSAWYDNDHIGQDFECARCRTRQLILKENWKKPDEPSWYYSLEEMVHQFYRNNGHITLLALRHIKGDSVNFQYLPEMELQEFKDNGKKMEIDIACIKNGEIYLGEAKNRQLTASDLNRSGDLRKYINLYNQLHPKPHRIVIATNYASVPAEVRRHINSSSIAAKTTYLLHDNMYGK